MEITRVVDKPILDSILHYALVLKSTMAADTGALIPMWVLQLLRKYNNSNTMQHHVFIEYFFEGQMPR